MIATKKIKFTEEALKQIEKIISENGLKKYFRISVKGGGCSGLSYDLKFTPEETGDTVFDYNGYKVFMDKRTRTPH